MRFEKRHLLGLADLTKEEIEIILLTAVPMKQIFTRSVKKVPVLRGKTVLNLFYEPSTRTRTSFEIAAKRLSADVINIAPSTSSITKGESLIDTVKTLEALNSDIIVVRHTASGAPHFLSVRASSPIINGGDGIHEHPTQGLLDLFTIKEKKGGIEGLKVLIVGDILHSRVSRSNIIGITKLGGEVRVVGPPTLLPREIESLGCKVFNRLEEALEDVDVIYSLRIQMERQNKKFFPSLAEYIKLYSINESRVSIAKKDVIIMHPGPMNRGVELSASIAYSKQSTITDQVTNGIAIRMAIFFLMLGGGRSVQEITD
ncbi:MAG: aspartate carbamoyltransferase catalytic subunit [Spirochaetota bacterium]|nr:aspartate carbamoyltransferase catalytic subunit [Spirochaetota bacterium]